MEFPPEMKDTSWQVVRSSDIKMSLRIQCLALYLYMRFCDIIDYWFPVRSEEHTSEPSHT